MSLAPNSATVAGMPAEQIAPRVLAEAAEWFAVLADSSADTGQRQQWQDWRQAHPDHDRAWRRVEQVTGQFSPLAKEAGGARRVLEAPPRAGRRHALRALCLLLIGGGGALGVARAPWGEWRYEYALRNASYRTAVAELRELSLPDRGHLWLGPHSAMDVEYSADERRLALYRGDLLVQTAPDTAQPPRRFLVRTPHGAARALGTRYAVRAGMQSTQVDVFEGAVEITPREAGGVVLTLRAGEQAVFDAERILSSGAAPASREAWSRGLLLADGMRLDNLLAELSRWHDVTLVCADDVAALRVVSVLPLMDLGRSLAALEDGLPVRITGAGSRRMVSRK